MCGSKVWTHEGRLCRLKPEGTKDEYSWHRDNGCMRTFRHSQMTAINDDDGSKNIVCLCVVCMLLYIFLTLKEINEI